MAVTVTAFWNIALGSLTELNRHLRGAVYHHHQGPDDGSSTHLWHVDQLLSLHGAISQKAVIFNCLTQFCMHRDETLISLLVYCFAPDIVKLLYWFWTITIYIAFVIFNMAFLAVAILGNTFKPVATWNQFSTYCQKVQGQLLLYFLIIASYYRN